MYGWQIQRTHLGLALSLRGTVLAKLGGLCRYAPPPPLSRVRDLARRRRVAQTLTLRREGRGVDPDGLDLAAATQYDGSARKGGGR